MSWEEVRDEAVSVLRDAKADALLLLSFPSGTGPASDRILIATALAPAHLQSMADKLAGLLRQARIESGDGWIVLDAGDVMIHLFLPDKRDFYGLEDLWGDAERLPL